MTIELTSENLVPKNLKSQLAPKFIVSNDCRADFWVFLYQASIFDLSAISVQVVRVDMAHSYVWCDSFMCVTCLIIYMTWPIHMCRMAHSYVWHGPFRCIARLIHMCGMAHSCVWHGPFICVTWLIRMCHMTHSHVSHDSFICVTMCHMTHSYASQDTF